MAHGNSVGITGRRLIALVAVLGLLLPLALTGCGLTEQTAETTSPGTPDTAPPAGGFQDRSATQGEAAKDLGAAGEPAPTPSSPGAGTTVPAGKLIVRNKTLRLEVKDVQDSIGKLRELVKRDGADISQMQVATSTDDPIYRPVDEYQSAGTQALQAWVTVRVPADKFQAFIDDAAKLGTVKFQTESAEDVTQQHVDLKARLENMRAEEAQLRDFFTKAKNVTEMLQIEQELARVRGEIESMTAQITYLERQAAMATVTIEMFEEKAVVRPPGIDWGTREALTKSVQAFVGTVNILIVVLGPILALLLFVALPAFLLARFAYRRYRRKQAARTAVQDTAQEAAREPGAGDVGA